MDFCDCITDNKKTNNSPDCNYNLRMKFTENISLIFLSISKNLFLCMIISVCKKSKCTHPTNITNFKNEK